MERIIVIWFLFFGLIGYKGSLAQVNISSFEEVDSLMLIQERPVLIFLHTSWCRYCEAMEAETFQNKAVQEKLNNDYYFISFDPELKNDIVFHGQVYNYIPSGLKQGVNEIAPALNGGFHNLSYPLIAILNPQYEVIYKCNSYLSASEMLRLLNAL